MNKVGDLHAHAAHKHCSMAPRCANGASPGDRRAGKKMISRPPRPRGAKLLTGNHNISIGSLIGTQTEKMTSRPQGPRRARLLTRNLIFLLGSLIGSQTEKMTSRPQGPRRAKLLTRNINISIGSLIGSQTEWVELGRNSKYWFYLSKTIPFLRKYRFA